MTDSVPALLGFQISDAAGNNIQGDDGVHLPQLATEYPSFAIFAPSLAAAIVARVGPGYLLQPIFEDEVENPLIVTAI